jgi:pentatricopeptide repeat protein
MRNSRHIPGPKAYHALIIGYVRGGNPKGALAAIREAWKHDIQPLAQSYAAIVAAFLQVGDIDTATAVYSANRRSSVSAQLSWAALTTAMLTSTSSTISERAVALLELVSLGILSSWRE